MPFYDYECSDCDTAQKKFHSMGESPTPCINCNGTNLIKKIGSIIVSSGQSEKTKAKKNIENFINDSKHNLDLMKDESQRREK